MKKKEIMMEKHTKQNFLLIICSIALLCSLGFNFYQYDKIQTIAKSNKDEVIYWAKNYTDEYNAHRESVNLLSEIKDEYFFYHNSAVIVSSPGGTKYHKYGCYHLGERFYIYNIENARAKGYTACADCEPDKILTSASNKIKKQRINSLVEEFPEKPAEPYKNN